LDQNYLERANLEEGDVQDFKGLKVWEKAHVLTVDVYRATSGFPRLRHSD
jgi:hypothetical protein